MGGQTVKAGSDPPFRVNSGPTGSTVTVQALGDTKHRSVCNPIQYTTPEILLSTPVAIERGSGCLISDLARNSLRLPSDQVDSQGHTEDDVGQSGNHNDSPTLALNAVVCTVVTTLSGPSTGVTVSSTSAVAGSTNSPKQRRKVPSARFEAFIE